jgi:hypothetical protein
VNITATATLGGAAALFENMATVESTGVGDIQIIGIGSDAVQTDSGSTIRATGTGAITITGTTTTSDDSDGVIADGSITTASGNITISGTGGNTGEGVELYGTVSAGGAGQIQIDGTSTDDDAAVYLDGTAVVETTGSGDIQIIGIGSDAVQAEPGSMIRATGSGAITITGTTTTTGDSDGVIAEGAITTASGNITISGTASDTGEGVELYGTTTAGGTGQIQITGSEVSGSEAVFLDDTATTGSATGTGGILITADSLVIDTNSTVVQNAGALIIQPQTPGTAINLGTGATDSGLQLTDGELGRLSNGFSSITIGDATSGTGAVDVNSSTFTDPVTIVGGSIAVTELKPLDRRPSSPSVSCSPESVAPVPRLMAVPGVCG